MRVTIIVESVKVCAGKCMQTAMVSYVYSNFLICFSEFLPLKTLRRAVKTTLGYLCSPVDMWNVSSIRMLSDELHTEIIKDASLPGKQVYNISQIRELELLWPGKMHSAVKYL